MAATGTASNKREVYVKAIGIALVVIITLFTYWQTEGSDEPADSDAPSVSAPQAPDPTATADPVSGLPLIDVDELPEEAVEMLARIEDGGPYEYDQDDATFFNREGLLPARETGYYREYTVETPGSPDRGARRIVAGESGERYYTDDHYDSFRAIRP